MSARNRRDVMAIGVSAMASGFGMGLMRKSHEVRMLRDKPGAKAPVAIVRAASYSAGLTRQILDGIRACGLQVRGKRILLKPNLVEFDQDTVINTDVAVVAAAFDAFSSLGAADVRIGEGPGHRRDTYGLAEQSGYRGSLTRFDDYFVDLNRDDVSPVEKFFGETEIYLPNSALRADLVVSMPKMKTHHWAGATLSMKNFFGLVPGAVYGWPKNTLHQFGIARSIIELNRVFSKTFAIVDGIVGMEGNGPIQGTPKPAGVLVMGADLRAVDATCCRLMGIDPARIAYIEGSAHLGKATENGIDLRGERLSDVRTPFGLIQDMADLRLEA